MNRINQRSETVLNNVREFIQLESDRRQKLLPGPPSIRVDGTKVGNLVESEKPMSLVLDRGAGMVELVGRDREGEVVLAAYLLTYDVPKTEVWNVTLPWGAEIVCRFQYSDEDRVFAEMELTSTSEIAIPSWATSRSQRNIGQLRPAVTLMPAEQLASAAKRGAKAMSLEGVCSSLDKAIESRGIIEGLDLLRENSDFIFSLDSSQEHAGSLVGRVAQWIDMDFSLLGRVEQLLIGPFAKAQREGLAHRDAVYLRLADGIVGMHRGNWKVAISDLEYVLASKIIDTNLRVVASYCLARCLRRRGEYDAASKYANDALELASGREKQAAVIVILHAWLLFQKGEFDEAGGLLRQAETTLEGTDDWLSKGNIFSAWGRMKRREDLEQSLRLFNRAVDAYGGAKHPNLARALANIALVEIMLAHSIQRRTEEKAKREGVYLELQHYCSQYLKGHLIKRFGELGLPAGVAGEVLGEIEKNILSKMDALHKGEKTWEGHLQNLQLLARKMKERIEALSGDLQRKKNGGDDKLSKLASLVEKILKEVNEVRGSGMAPQRPGRILTEAEEWERLLTNAKKHLAEAEAIYRDLDHRRGMGTCHLCRAFMHIDGEELDAAEEEAQKAYDLGVPVQEGETNDRFLLGRARVLQCRIENEKCDADGGRPEWARQCAAEAIELAEATQNCGLRARAHMAMAFTLSNRKAPFYDPKKVWLYYKKAADQVNKGRLAFLHQDLESLAERLIAAGVVKSDLVEWMVTE